MLFVILIKTLYETLSAALLSKTLLSSKLKEWGFKLNLYYQCVANKTNNGK